MSQRQRAFELHHEAPRASRLLGRSSRDHDASPFEPADVSPFDADAWTILIDEQRNRIARAAGVDPSKVRIKIGH